MNARIKKVYGSKNVPNLEDYVVILPLKQISIFDDFAVYGELYDAKPNEVIPIKSKSNFFSDEKDVIYYLKTGNNDKDSEQKRLIKQAKFQIKFAKSMESKIRNMKMMGRKSCELNKSSKFKKIEHILADKVCEKFGIRKESLPNSYVLYNDKN